ncbi:sensor histidine kinase [Rathayibacter sp. KR2-224]|uniref:sensor histidine kinase n=1 Tax=Rathayibacter sp. KR2-224 TaxID=3400913 RepID=UPI003C094A1C
MTDPDASAAGEGERTPLLTGAAQRAPASIVLWTLVVLGAAAVLTVSSSLSSSAFGVPVAIALLLAGIQAAAMVLGLLNPPIAAALSVLGVFGFALVTPPGGPWPVMVTSMIAHVTVVLLVTRTQWLTGLTAVLVGVLGATIIAFTSPVPEPVQGAATADLIVFASVSAIAWLVGLLVGRWNAARAQLRRERAVSAAELARRQEAEERTRLARELHDVVAHGMSAIQVQASSAKYRLPSLPVDVVEEFDSIASLARESMGEMRALLRVLRNEDAPGEVVPQPTASDVPQLIRSASRAGSRVELSNGLSQEVVFALDPVVSLTVYRVVQEALSNVARHATGADTLVTLEHTGRNLNVEVRNSAPAVRAAAAGATDAGGQGIRGMRERVELHGGTLQALPTDDGGFVVRAAIPLRQREDAA